MLAVNSRPQVAQNRVAQNSCTYNQSLVVATNVIESRRGLVQLE